MKLSEGQRLKNFRESKNKSQVEFAEKLSVSRELLSGMENDNAPVSKKTKKALVKEYGFDVDTNSVVNEDEQGYGKLNMEMGFTQMFSMIVEMRAEMSAHTSALAEVLSKQTGEGSTKFLEEIQTVYSSKLRALKTGLKERQAYA